MKRLVVGLLLAATAWAPIAASAQRREQSVPVTDDVDRTERSARREAREERRAARAEAGVAAQAPAADAERREARQERRAARAQADVQVQPPAATIERPRRDRDGDGRPDRVEVARPDDADRVRRRVRADRSELGRPDRGQRPIRREDSSDFADYETDPRNARPDRFDERRDLGRGDRDLRQDRRDRRRDGLGGSPFRDSRGLDDRDRYDARDQDRSRNLYRGGQVWNRGWRTEGRYDWNRYRDRNRGAFRLPRYYAPPGAGYGYRRFGPGVQLSGSLFARDYWLDDPYAYRLPPAYGPYRWVRYHGDALLVDLRTGRVIDVVYDIFY